MDNISPPHRIALVLATAWSRLERQLTTRLSNMRGISFGEFRILQSLSVFPEGTATRVDLASAVGLTPSGITRALKPLEKIGVVTTVRSERDARLALASLTEIGREVVAECTQGVDEAMTKLVAESSSEEPSLVACLEVLTREA